MVDFCESRKIYLIMDDIYHKLIFDGVKAPSAYSFTKKDVAKSYIIVTNGVSKLLRHDRPSIGWVVGNRKIIEADRLPSSPRPRPARPWSPRRRPRAR
jgi:aspartate aminotransferase